MDGKYGTRANLRSDVLTVFAWIWLCHVCTISNSWISQQTETESLSACDRTELWVGPPSRMSPTPRDAPRDDLPLPSCRDGP